MAMWILHLNIEWETFIFVRLAGSIKQFYEWKKKENRLTIFSETMNLLTPDSQPFNVKAKGKEYQKSRSCNVRLRPLCQSVATHHHHHRISCRTATGGLTKLQMPRLEVASKSVANKSKIWMARSRPSLENLEVERKIFAQQKGIPSFLFIGIY